MGRKLLLIPYWLWFLFLLLGPILTIAVISFFTRDSLGQLVPAFSLDSYKALSEPVFLAITLRTLLMASTASLLALALAYPLAYFLARLQPRWQPLFLSLVMIPFWTNYLVRVLAYMDFLRWELFGVSLLFTPTGILVGLVYTYLPFALLPLYASLRTIDFSALEAAQDLGANFWQCFWHILWPLSQPGIRNALLFVLVPCLGEYLLPELVGGGKFYMLGSLLQHQFLNARNWPMGSAMVIVMIVCALCFFALLSRKPKQI